MSAGDWKDMYAAALRGDLALVRYHIENEVNPNYQHPEILATPLVAAISGGHTEVALYLLENGADPNLKSFFDDTTPHEAAARNGNDPVLQRLSELGVLPTKPRNSSWFSRGLSHLRNLFGKASGR